MKKKRFIPLLILLSLLIVTPLLTNTFRSDMSIINAAQDNNEDIKLFVTRLYSTCLNRKPDSEGLNYWSNALKNKNVSSAEAADFFYTQKEFQKLNLTDSQFLDRLYLTFMNRAADAKGKAFWQECLRNGCRREGVLRAFLASTEFSDICKSYALEVGSIPAKESQDENLYLTMFINRLYQEVFERKADTDGLNYWAERVLQGKASAGQVASNFFLSKEFEKKNYSDSKYLQILYQAMMDRQPDKQGLQDWEKALKSGMSRKTVFDAFVKSQEFKTICADYGLTDNSGSTPSTGSKSAKYVFLFIGDGMSHVQINAAQAYLENNTSGSATPRKFNFTRFPVTGSATTHDLTSLIPDSASTATAIATGTKTHSGVIGLQADKKTVAKNISEIYKELGMKIGIVSSVTINHATPSAFYAHVPSRSDTYDIAIQLANSGYDYFAGGTLLTPSGSDGKQPNAFDIIKSKGYTIADTPEAIRKLNPSSGKIYAISPKLQDSGAMPYTLDANPSDISLSDFVEKGIEVLDNEKGFFMICESGKVDWACHANDALSTITDIIHFESAIQKAVDFAKKHPDETLIIVTGDHETGGMSIGKTVTGYDTAFSILSRQKMSYIVFNSLIGDLKTKNSNLKLEDVLPVIKDNFGLIAPGDPDAKNTSNKAFLLTDSEYNKLKTAFATSMKTKDGLGDSEASLLYGGYDPLSVTLTHIINNKAGIDWTTYNHTSTPVPIYSMGAGSELFNGSYDNTDIFKKMQEAVKR